jgi:hypothetical protein
MRNNPCHAAGYGLTLIECAPGVPVDDLVARTGAPLVVGDDVITG